MSIVKIIAENIRIPYSPHLSELDRMAEKEAAKIIKRKTGCTPISLNVAKKSIDARRRDSILFVLSVCAEIEWKGDTAPLKEKGFKLYRAPEIDIAPGEERAEHRHVIVGFGPAGIFAGLLLAEHGYRPLIFERGASVSERVEKVAEAEAEVLSFPSKPTRPSSSRTASFPSIPLT